MTVSSAARRSAAAPGTKWAEVDVAALRENTAALRRLAGPGCAVMAMVKANGYGHGALLAATATVDGGATWLGVSSVTEAVDLRRAGVTARVLNVGWTAPSEMPTAVAHDIDVTVFDASSVAAAAEAARQAGRPARVHWKLDTGMGRLGTRAGDVDAVRDALMAAGTDLVTVALFTHFAAADAPSTDFTTEQHDQFLGTVAGLRDTFPHALLHCANSAALLRSPETHHDIVRPGIALYGYPPPHCAGVVELRPALRLQAMVTQVKTLDEGTSVGYGREWCATRRSRVATVAAGYADGVDRRNGNRGRVIVGGAICPIIGRVSMDQIGVDVTAGGPVRPGDAATLIGESDGHRIDADDVAASIGTISNEVLCAVAARVPRVAVSTGEESP
ncbi:MAG: alanine racemase [Candidatus Dormibacteraeota bacterium]|uniref:Alanine racemase n=1 Tax=Candidatus Amunia macphersoniae TaxID=3127014 RepID=A0A934KQ47_9BACT|nr:alanine racemase [Candidatus Dormibacteraeota bacterium]